MSFDYGGKPRAGFTDDEDRFLIVQLNKFGYATAPWEELRQAIREHSLFRFDWFMKSRSVDELKRRSNSLISCIQKEHASWSVEEGKGVPSTSKGKRAAGSSSASAKRGKKSKS